MRKYILLLLVFWASLSGAYAQDNFPVTASATLLPAQTWSDIYSSDNFLRVTLLLKDNSKSNVPVFLKIKLERVGLIIQSKPDYVPTHPINLAFGVPQSLGGYELKEYFNPNNLEIEGLDESFLRNGGHLPDGFYTFSVTAFEFDPARGHRQVSNTGVGQMTIFLGLPPIITFPAEGQVISDAYPQSILFQWMPRATAAQNGTMGVLYEFKIFEVGDDEEPSEVVQAKQPILTESVQMPNLLYNTTKPSLIAGKRYAVQVQVQSADGSTSFQNNGYSQIVSFYYGQPCTPPENVTVSQTSTSTAKIEWTPLDAAQTYDISYRVAGGTWKTITSYFSPVNINKDQDYTEFKVRCNCSSSRSSSWADATAAASPNAKTVMTANAPVALMMAAPPNTTGQTLLDIVLNPLDITVSSQGISTDDQNTLLAKLNDPANIIPPKPCNMAARKSAADCNPDASVNYQGNIDFIPIKGSEIFINGYSIVVSNVNGPAGEGLLFLPYLMKRIPVFWNGVTIKEGETTPKFGCITVGEVKAQGSQDGVLTQDLQRQVTQLLTQPGEFTGKLGEALDKFIAKVDEMTSSPNDIVDNDYKLLTSYLTAGLGGTDNFVTQLQSITGLSNDAQSSLSYRIIKIQTLQKDLVVINNAIKKCKKDSCTLNLQEAKTKVQSLKTLINQFKQENDFIVAVLRQIKASGINNETQTDISALVSSAKFTADQMVNGEIMIFPIQITIDGIPFTIDKFIIGIIQGKYIIQIPVSYHETNANSAGIYADTGTANFMNGLGILGNSANMQGLFEWLGKKEINVILFVNGYRGPDQETTESDDEVVQNDRHFYWNTIGNEFISRRSATQKYYADGHCRITTSSHQNGGFTPVDAVPNAIFNFAKSAATSFSAKYTDKTLFDASISTTTFTPTMQTFMIFREFCKLTDCFVTLNDKPNNDGFNHRAEKGKIAAGKLISKLKMITATYPNTKIILDVVAHSMGFAYAQGMISVLKTSGLNIKSDGYYILAPENGCGGNVNPSDWNEVWQYGSNYKQSDADPIFEQDGVAPQCAVVGLENNSSHFGRAFIPQSTNYDKNFVNCHLIANYGWVFNQPKGSNGYVTQK